MLFMLKVVYVRKERKCRIISIIIIYNKTRRVNIIIMERDLSAGRKGFFIGHIFFLCLYTMVVYDDTFYGIMHNFISVIYIIILYIHNLTTV